jgi:hypothetical protein
LAQRGGRQDITLLKTHGTIDNEINSYEVIGTGEAVRYVAENLYRNDLPLGQAVLLGTHLVSVAKKYAQGVGGDTHILILTSDGRMEFERIEFSRKQEEFFEEFNDSLKDLTLSSPDTGLTNEQVFQKLEVFVKRFIELRERYFTDVMSESLRQALSGTGHGDVYSRFPVGHTTEQGSAEPLLIEVELSPTLQLAKALSDLSQLERQSPEKQEPERARKESKGGKRKSGKTKRPTK